MGLTVRACVTAGGGGSRHPERGDANQHQPVYWTGMPQPWRPPNGRFQTWCCLAWMPEVSCGDLGVEAQSVHQHQPQAMTIQSRAQPRLPEITLPRLLLIPLASVVNKRPHRLRYCRLYNLNWPAELPLEAVHNGIIVHPPRELLNC